LVGNATEEALPPRARGAADPAPYHERDRRRRRRDPERGAAVLDLVAANRDPQVFDDPSPVDLEVVFDPC
jgi:hypothetical protein